MTVTEETLIPATREEVVSQLNTLGTMTTSTEWERSALVYALTVDGRTVAGRNRNSGNPELAKVTFQELASWGIVGLTDKSHVAAYHKYWANAVAEGFALPAVLGEPYDEPETEWPGFPKQSVPKPDEAESPLTQFCNQITAGGKRHLAALDVAGMDASDAHEARKTVQDAHEILTEVDEFLDVLEAD